MDKRQLYTIFSAFLLVFTVGACAPIPPQPQLVAEADPIVLRLAEAADRAATSLDTLAAVEQKRTPTTLPPLTASAPTKLRRSVSVSWIGPVEPMVQRLADRASYTFITSGDKPVVPIVVTLNTRSQSVIEVLRDIGLQLNDRATIKVDANKEVIEIYYASVTEDK